MHCTKVVSKDNKFNISCSTSDLSIEDEIEIIESQNMKNIISLDIKIKKQYH